MALPSASNSCRSVNRSVANRISPVPFFITYSTGMSPACWPWLVLLELRCAPALVKGGTHWPTACTWNPWKPGGKPLTATRTRTCPSSSVILTDPTRWPAASRSRALAESLSVPAWAPLVRADSPKAEATAVKQAPMTNIGLLTDLSSSASASSLARTSAQGAAKAPDKYGWHATTMRRRSLSMTVPYIDPVGQASPLLLGKIDTWPLPPKGTKARKVPFGKIPVSCTISPGASLLIFA
jgi:hypothetical protein